METLISNISYAKSMLAAFGVVWIVFLIYTFRLIQKRKILKHQMELLKNIGN
ncbi:MAG: CcmD family protein [Methanosarcinales archaeon]|nr:CcmD family protein [Methanosarcinales archaeon]